MPPAPSVAAPELAAPSVTAPEPGGQAVASSYLVGRRLAAGSQQPGRHRAPAKPLAPALLGERGRHAVMTAALVAGVSAGVVSGATATAQPSRAATDQAPALPAAPAPSPAALTPSPESAAPVLAAGETASVLAGETAPVLAGEAAPVLAGEAAAVLAGSEVTTPFAPASRAGVRAARKPKPLPPPPVAQWVHPMPEGSVTSCFGPRWGRLHAGVDLATASGTPIRAAGAGVVTRAGEANGYGLAVLIDHGNGYLTHYGHMSAIGVTEGQVLKAGEEIGKEGSTGHSTGPHLHFEVHEGTYQNPIEPTAWMAAHGVDLDGCASDEPHPEES